MGRLVENHIGEKLRVEFIATHIYTGTAELLRGNVAMPFITILAPVTHFGVSFTVVEEVLKLVIVL